MIKNYLVTAYRRMMNHKIYSLINILGLAIGLACFFLITMLVDDETSYDRFHQDVKNIYRLSIEFQMPDQIAPMTTAIGAVQMGTIAKLRVPEVVDAVRMLPYYEGALPARAAISYGDREFNEHFYWVDHNFFEVFNFPLKYGDPKTVFKERRDTVMTEEAAQRYFGDENPIGEVVSIDNGYIRGDYKIAGVMENLPLNTHMKFDVLTASVWPQEYTGEERESWWDLEHFTYLKLVDNAPVEEVEKKLTEIYLEYMRQQGDVKAHLTPITDIHLRSDLLNELQPNSDIAYVYTFVALALAVLLLACVNFMNLSTARSADRAKEVGLRKVAGARRYHLILQFLGESLSISFVALLLAFLLVKLFLPSFNDLVGKEMAIQNEPTTWLVCIGIWLFVGIFSGIYPAFFLSAFKPIVVLQGGLASGRGKSTLRAILVVFQFSVSVILIIGAFVIFDQLNFMRSYDLGMDKERILILLTRDTSLQERYMEVKEILEGASGVVATTFSAVHLGSETPQIDTQVIGKSHMNIGTLVVDHDFADVLGTEIVAGRTFSKDSPSDVNEAFIINESAVQELGLESPEKALGAPILWGYYKKGKIIGVVKDFHYQPVKYELLPLILHIRPERFNYLLVRISGANIPETLKSLEEAWDRAFPLHLFEYNFLDDRFDQLYRSEERLGKAFGYFALVAIFVACLGLLGFASFVTEQRTKEIGIRKSLGASAQRIIVMLSMDFLRLVVLAILIGWPLAYLVMNRWLQDFSLRTDISFLHFLTAGLVVALSAWVAVGYQAIKAAVARPSQSLSYE